MTSHPKRQEGLGYVVLLLNLGHAGDLTGVLCSSVTYHNGKIFSER